MPTVEAIRWYADSGRFQDVGYAIPYVHPNKTHTNNSGIKSFVDTLGKHLFAIMHEPDVNSTAPPKRPWLELVHKSILRARDILVAEQVKSNERDRRPISVTPTPEPFLIYPVPYFRVRNPWAKKWCRLILMGIAECMQHQDNIHPLSIHEDFASIAWQYPNMVYEQLGIEFFRKDRLVVKEPTFELTDADFDSFDERAIFTRTDRVDSRAPLLWQVSAEDLTVLAEGIAAPVVLEFARQWPLQYIESADGNVAGAPPAEGSKTAVATATTTAVAAPAPPAI